MVAHGTVGGEIVPSSCVAWNPDKVKAEEMRDLGSDQYVDMLCVEQGLLGPNVMEMGLSAAFVQVLQMPQDPPAT
jgi:glucose-6-phosphate 1-epimerase